MTKMEKFYTSVIHKLIALNSILYYNIIVISSKFYFPCDVSDPEH